MCQRQENTFYGYFFNSSINTNWSTRLCTGPPCTVSNIVFAPSIFFSSSKCWHFAFVFCASDTTFSFSLNILSKYDAIPHFFAFFFGGSWLVLVLLLVLFLDSSTLFALCQSSSIFIYFSLKHQVFLFTVGKSKGLWPAWNLNLLFLSWVRSGRELNSSSNALQFEQKWYSLKTNLRSGPRSEQTGSRIWCKTNGTRCQGGSKDDD